MAKRIQLSIDEPCHENWEAMTGAGNGRFCGSCQKQVIDFTEMSDAQVAAFFRKPSTGSVCGRFMQDQLDRNITIPTKRIPWVKYFFQLTLPLFLASLKSNAQKGKVTVRQTKINTTNNVRMMGAVAFRPEEQLPLSLDIKGKVIDEEGKPIPYASIVIKGTALGIAADSLGQFTMVNQLKKMNNVLSVSCVGFLSKDIPVSMDDIAKGKEITIQLGKPVLQEVVVTSYGTVRRYEVMGGVSRVTGKTITKTITKAEPPATTDNITAMRVYPNPVKAGSAININCAKMEESYYSFQLLTMSGQATMQKEVWIDKGAGVFNMPIPVMSAGTYLLRMTSKLSGKSFTEKIIIQKN